MFAKPRPKKSPLPPLPSKKRKLVSAVEEVNFDNDARHEYLTGFHKRKQQRIKNAQEVAEKKAREEKIEARKQMREERRKDVEEHVQTVNRMLRESAAVHDGPQSESESEKSDDWDGFPDQPDLELVDHEEEYIDEDRYTTVTVESVAVSRDGFSKPGGEKEEDASAKDDAQDEASKDDADETKKERSWPKKKKKKFRYESKIERQLTDRKQKAKNRSRRPQAT